jgi:hypothetical protein
MAKNNSKLVTKVSPLIEGQVPDFVQAEHKTFTRFLKHYYQYLEAGRITYSGELDYLRLETNTLEFILQNHEAGLHDNEDRIVTETGTGTTGLFVTGETITGETSKATATILVEHGREKCLYITSQQKFITGEKITGGTSGAEATITTYRANPIQNIQQLLEYANVDNTIYDFLDQMRDQFMNAIPETLATGVSKRKLIKNIKDLYGAKGTSKGHELFFKAFLGETPEIAYPTEFLMRSSDGKWTQKSTIRVTAGANVTGDEVVNQVITGGTSGATAVVVSSQSFTQGLFAVTELELQSVEGTFVDGETITGTSNTRDVDVTFTVSSQMSESTLTNDGILNSTLDTLSVESLGSGVSEVVVEDILTGSISEVIVDDVGQQYEVGDAITFTSDSNDTDISAATGIVSVVGGGILQEAGTLDDSDITTDNIILESGTDSGLVPFEFILEDGNLIQEDITPDSSTKVFTLSSLNANTDNIRIFRDNIQLNSTDAAGDTVWSVSGTTLTFTNAPTAGIPHVIKGNVANKLLLDRSSVGGSDAGHNLLTDTVQEEDDTYSNGDLFVLEENTFATQNEATSIRKVQVTDGGNGYSKLPTVSVTSDSGTGASLLANTTDIGRANGIEIRDGSFDLDSSNPPEVTFQAHFVLKDVTGTFASGNTLTTHTGTVSGWNADTQVLSTTFENVVRVDGEATTTVQNGIRLENNLEEEPHGILLEDVLDFDDGENFLLNATGITTPARETETFKVTVGRNSTDTANIFYINGVANPKLSLARGNTYRFDTSDSSLYNIDTTQNHQLLFASTKIAGSTSGGTAYTTGVTQSVVAVTPIGTTGSFIQIVVADDAPQLYYYCANHSGMGNSILSFTRPNIINGVGDRIVIDADSKIGDDGILLESGTTRAKSTDQLVQETGQAINGALGSGDGGKFILEHQHIDGGVPINVGEPLVIDRYREEGGTNYVIIENGDATDRLSTEELGTALLLEDRDRILHEEDIQIDEIVLDATDSSSTDAGDNIINESGIDFSNDNVTITDSGGATATIVSADIATGTVAVSSQKTNVGAYAGIDSLVGEDLNRLQDSYFYQDYSYEVRIGESLSTYLNELKKAVHPAGFIPFGKVSIASQISARVTTTAVGVSGYTGDDTFSPELASTFETLFDEHIKISHRTAVGIQDHDQNIVLDGTDGSSTNAGDGILYETATGDTGRGIITSESAKGIGGESQRAIIHSREVRINSNPVSRVRDNVLLHLAKYPFRDACGIMLESGASSLVLDGIKPFDDPVLLILEDDTGSICLEGCRPGTGRLLAENNRVAVPIDMVMNENEKILFSDDDNDTTLTFDEIGTIPFEHILEPDQLTLSDDADNVGVTGFVDSIIMENEGELLLDGTNSAGADAGFKLLQNTKETVVTEQDEGFIVLNGTDTSGTDEGFRLVIEPDTDDLGFVVPIKLERDTRTISTSSKRATFILEETGVLITEDNDPTSVNDIIASDNLSEAGGILMEDIFATTRNDRIKLEYGEGVILMDGSGVTLSTGIDGSPITPYDEDAGFAVTFETEITDQPRVAMETYNIKGSEGHEPRENFRLSSQNETSYKSKYGYTPVVVPAEITVRSTGDIALEDATDDTHGFLVLDTAAHAGDNIDLEGATGITH